MFQHISSYLTPISTRTETTDSWQCCFASLVLGKVFQPGDKFLFHRDQPFKWWLFQRYTDKKRESTGRAGWLEVFRCRDCGQMSQQSCCSSLPLPSLSCMSTICLFWEGSHESQQACGLNKDHCYTAGTKRGPEFLLARLLVIATWLPFNSTDTKEASSQSHGSIHYQNGRRTFKKCGGMEKSPGLQKLSEGNSPQCTIKPLRKKEKPHLKKNK